MDPATTFSAIHLIDFGIRAVKAFHEIYISKDALTTDNTRSDLETQALRTASSQVSSQLQGLIPSQLSPEQAHLKRVAEKCDQLAKDLITRLDKLKVVVPRSRRKVPVQWMKLMREKGTIQKDHEQLQRCKALLDTQMIVTLWYIPCLDHFPKSFI